MNENFEDLDDFIQLEFNDSIIRDVFTWKRTGTHGSQTIYMHSKCIVTCQRK